MNEIFKTWATPAVDMFSTVHNMHLPYYMSPVPEPQALTIDAASQDWQGWSMYMFPPFPLLSQVIQKPRTTQEGKVILIAPGVHHYCGFHPLFFPYRRDLHVLSQQGYVSSGKSYHLHSWRLSCSATKQQDFQKRSIDPLHLLEGPL